MTAKNAHLVRSYYMGSPTSHNRGAPPQQLRGEPSAAHNTQEETVPDQTHASASTSPKHHEAPAERTYRITTNHTYFTADALTAMQPQPGSILTVNTRCPQQNGQLYARWCPAHDCILLSTRHLQPGDALTNLGGRTTGLLLDHWINLRPIGAVLYWDTTRRHNDTP